MKCPICNIEAKVESMPQFVKKGDGYFHKMVFTCRCKDCSKFGKEIATDYIPIEVIEEQAEQESE